MPRWLRAIFFQTPMGPTESCGLIVAGGGYLLVISVTSVLPRPSDPWPLWALWWLVAAAAVGLLARGLVGCLAWLMRMSPITAQRSPSSVRIEIRFPTIRSKRRLKRDTLSVVSDIRAYLRTVTPPSVIANAEFDVMRLAMRSTLDKAEQTRIWNEQTAKTIERSATAALRLKESFGGRIHFVLAEFIRLGRIDKSQARYIEQRCDSEYFIADAASELEALALGL